jgi:hypothetical protein
LTFIDINDEAVRCRLKLNLANSRTGREWGQSGKLNAPLTQAVASKTGTPATPGVVSNSRASSFLSSKSPEKSSSNISSDHFEKPSTPQHKQFSNSLTPSLPITMYPYFDNLYNGFKEEFAQTIKVLEDNGSAIVNIGAEQSIPTILAIIQTNVDPFLPKAFSLNQKQVSELPAQFELGYTKDFCPFALRQANILQKGSPNFAVKYQVRVNILFGQNFMLIFVLVPSILLIWRRSPDSVPFGTS